MGRFGEPISVELADRMATRLAMHTDRSGGPDACWTWTGSRHPNGPGRMSAPGGNVVLVHSVAHVIACREALPYGSRVIQSCNNRVCCNPAHLGRTERSGKTPKEINNLKRAEYFARRRSAGSKPLPRGSRERLLERGHDGKYCEICRRPRGNKSLNVDHDHATGWLRGFLCTPCNIGLGYFYDQPMLLRRAAEYVQSAGGDEDKASQDETVPVGAVDIEDKGVISPADAVISMNLAEQTRKVLATLTPRQEKVLRMRFGIGEKSDHTMEEVGGSWEVTRERIKQIEAKQLRKLRHPSRSKRLRSFMENQ